MFVKNFMNLFSGWQFNELKMSWNQEDTSSGNQEYVKQILWNRTEDAENRLESLFPRDDNDDDAPLGQS